MKHLGPLLLCASLLGCAEPHDSSAPDHGPFIVGVLPDQTDEAVLARHTPLLDYLANATSLDIELLISSDYADLVEQFRLGHVDLAWFGGLTFIQAEASSGAEALAFRDVDIRFTSCYLARVDDSRSNVREFEDAKFSFGPQLSTSGHLMPRFFLERDGIQPEQFFGSTRHSPGHDQTARFVAEGDVDIGVANCIIVQSMFDDGALDPAKVRIIETTPPYSDYVWATHPSVDEPTRELLLDALLALDATNPEHRRILRLQGANAYLPASPSNFVLVRQAARSQGLVAEESSN